MKYVLAALAVIAAVAALFFRPPQNEPKVSLTGKADRVGLAPSPPPELGTQARLPLRRIVVYVAGEIMKPGLYTLEPQQRVADAVARAGGAKSDADLVAVNMAAPLEDGEEIAVPKIGAPVSHRRVAATANKRATRGHRRRNHKPAVPAVNGEQSQSVDLNSADEGLLETLPGIGSELAARIVAYRETNGPFASLDELADVAGITPHLQDALSSMLVIR